jgi:geranylgeranyl diphosphate synthase type II
MAVGKSTYPSLVGMEESKRIAADLISKAKQELEGFDPVKVKPLIGLADYIQNRKN